MSLKTVAGVLLLVFSVHGNAEALSPQLLQEIKLITKTDKNDIVYVDFWASWCRPCRKSFPWMNTMQEKYQDRGLKVLAVNLDKERNLAESFLKTVPALVQVMYDPEGHLAADFDVQAMPSSFIIDGEGRIRHQHKGFFEDRTDDYEDEIRSLIEKQGH